MSRRLLISPPVYNRFEKGSKSLADSVEVTERLMQEFNVSREWLTEQNSNFNYKEENAEISGKSFYNVPKEMMDFFARQQAIMEKLITLIK